MSARIRLLSGKSRPSSRRNSARPHGQDAGPRARVRRPSGCGCLRGCQHPQATGGGVEFDGKHSSGVLASSFVRAKLLREEGGALTFDAKEIVAEQQRTARLELVHGFDRFQTLAVVPAGPRMLRSHCTDRNGDGPRYRNRDGCFGAATGPSRWAMRLVLVTNAHVVSPSGRPFPGALLPGEVVANFQVAGAQNQARRYRLVIARRTTGLRRSSTCERRPRRHRFDSRRKLSRTSIPATAALHHRSSGWPGSRVFLAGQQAARVQRQIAALPHPDRRRKLRKPGVRRCVARCRASPCRGWQAGETRWATWHVQSERGHCDSGAPSRSEHDRGADRVIDRRQARSLMEQDGRQ